MSELPKGWVKAKISDVTFKCNQSKPDDEVSIKYIDIGSINRQTKKIENPQYLLGKDAPSRARKIVNTNDVLVSLTRPNLNAVALVDETFDEQFASTGFEVLKSLGVESRYLFALVRTNQFVNSISGSVQGALYPAAKSSDVQRYEFPLAPLKEQIRIADKLDSILAKVDQAQVHLKNIPTILKRFRQSVLAAATSGELTREWRGNEDSNWETISFGALIKNGPQNGIYKPSTLYGSGTKIIRIDGFYDGVLSPWSTIKRVQLETAELAKWKLNIDDILINRVNSIEYLGKCGHVNDLLEDAVFESNIMRVELDKSLAIPRFIKFFLSSPIGLSRLRSNAKHAVNQASINQTDVKSVEIQLPSLEEQTQIANKIEELFCKADFFETQYLEAEKFINRLSHSTLAKAFRGELVEQDPNDEPASRLIERMKKQQLDMSKAAKKPRKTRKKMNSEVEVVTTTTESRQSKSEILSLLQKTNGELTAQQIMDKLTEQTFEQVDVLFTELKVLLDDQAITKAGTGENCTFKVVKK